MASTGAHPAPLEIAQQHPPTPPTGSVPAPVEADITKRLHAENSLA
jgi:hypothetical protein